MKLVALYKRPEDTDAFDEAYFNTHMPLIRKLPDLERTVISRFTRTLMGDEYYMMAEMYFPDTDKLKAAMKSPEMAAAGENLNSFASGLVTLMFAQEED